MNIFKKMYLDRRRVLNTKHEIGMAIKEAIDSNRRWGYYGNRRNNDSDGTYLTDSNVALINNMIKAFGQEEIVKAMQYLANKHDIAILLHEPIGKDNIQVFIKSSDFPHRIGDGALLIRPAERNPWDEYI